MGHRAGLDDMEKRKFLTLPGRPARTDCTVITAVQPINRNTCGKYGSPNEKTCIPTKVMHIEYKKFWEKSPIYF
jgi:hypothetical protein